MRMGPTSCPIALHKPNKPSLSMYSLTVACLMGCIRRGSIVSNELLLENKLISCNGMCSEEQIRYLGSQRG